MKQLVNQGIDSCVKELQSDSTTNNSKEFDIVFSYLQDSSSNHKSITPQSYKHQLLVNVENPSNLNEIELKFDFDSGVFNIEKQKEASLHFIKLLETYIEDPTQTINAVNLITETEIAKINTWNNTSVAYEKGETLLTKFEAQVLSTPDKKALIFEDTHISYKSLNEKSNQVARFLIDKGVTSNDIVAVSLDRSIEMMIYIYGIIKAGAAYLPVDKTTPINRLEFILNDANTNFLFYNHDSFPRK